MSVQAAYTFHPNHGTDDDYMVVATRAEWEALFKYENQSIIDAFKDALKSQGIEVD